MSEPCKVDMTGNKGWCERHRMHHLGFLYVLSQEDTDRGRFARQDWDRAADDDQGGSPIKPTITTTPSTPENDPHYRRKLRPMTPRKPCGCKDSLGNEPSKR